jgi:hypothetical protein
LIVIAVSALTAGLAVYAGISGAGFRFRLPGS